MPQTRKESSLPRRRTLEWPAFLQERRVLTTSLWPFWRAIVSGVALSLVAASASAPAARRMARASVWPL